MRKKTYYLLYKITNLLNGMIYIGVHKTQNKDDNYMGSGKLIQRAVKKHGIKNFKKEIIKECSSQKELFESESQMVNESFVKRKDTYNLTLGGNGSWSHIKGTKFSKKHKEKIGLANSISQLGSLNSQFGTMWITNESENRKVSKDLKRLPKGFRKGMVHSEKAKVKMRLNNPNKNKIWIHNLKEKKSIMIYKKQLNSYLLKEWIKGRKMNFN